MAPARATRKAVVISSDEEDISTNPEDIPSDDNFHQPTASHKRQTANKILAKSPQKSVSSKPSSAKSSPQKKGKAKAKAPDSSNNSKAKGTIFSFFNATTQKQQSTLPKAPEVLPETADEDIIDGIDDGDGHIPVLNGSSTALAARKRKQNDIAHLFDPDVSNAASASQKFRKTSAGSKVASNTTPVDRRSWTDRFAPVDLTELAVHKKKVTDVRALLEESLSPRARPRLIVLKGPAGVGKTTTLRLLASDLGVGIKEWVNPTDVTFGQEGSASTASQFEDYIFRGANFAGLEIGVDPGAAPRPSNDDGASANAHKTVYERQILLVEEFPVSLAPSSKILQAFRATLLAHLSAPRSSPQARAPVVIIMSESVYSASEYNESMTVHRLLGSGLLEHPMTASIEFNPIAPTLLTKALSLIAVKESRVSGRRRTPGPAVLFKLAEMGDIRSAVSTLQFLCLRGDDESMWSAKINFSKTKGTKGASKAAANLGEGMTDLEAEALKIIGGRDTTLELWHGVGKVVYNKRLDPPKLPNVPLPAPHLMPFHKPMIPENDPELLFVELATDPTTFVAAVHENVPPSWSTTSSDRTLESMDECLTVLSDADHLTIDKYVPRQGSGNALEVMRQEEMAFHTAIRGVVFHLPHPVKRDSGQPAARGRPNAMSWPRSLRLWRQIEETENLIELCMSGYDKIMSHDSFILGEHKSDAGQDGTIPTQPRPSASSQAAMILEQAPYMRLIHEARRNASQLQQHIRKATHFETLHAADLAGGLHSATTGPDEDDADRSPGRKRRTRTGKDGSDFPGFGVEDDIKALILSDDDIVDD